MALNSTNNRQNFKLEAGDNFVSCSLLKNIIETSDIKKAVVEEKTSELWYETLHGQGKITFKNNISYEGNLKYGILNNENPETPCTLTFPDGTKYIGTLKNNRITGEGTYYFSNGATYKGSVLNGLRDGYGSYKSVDNKFYEGEWKSGLKHGKGKIIQGNMELEGEWKFGILCGKCKIKWKSGNFFEGQLVNNAMNGDGYMIWYNQLEKYIGQWKNNLQNGYGVHIWYDNKPDNKFFRDRYVGEWKNGKREGYGKFFFSDGRIYEGYWKNNKKEGFGVYYFQDKTKYVGNFKDDIMIDRMSQEQLKAFLKINTTTNNVNENLSNVSNVSVSRVSKKGATMRKDPNAFNNNINKNDQKESQKELNVIKENEEKKEIIETERKKEKLIKDKKDRINKNIDDIKISVFLNDLISTDPQVKKSLKELDNILLRNISIITHLYMVACGKEDIKSSDFGMSTMIADPKTAFKKKEDKSEKQKVSLEDLQLPLQNEEKKEIKVEYDNVYNNDVYFCLDFKNFWKLVRDCGLITADFSLAMLDRICLQNIDNYIEMYYIPILFERNNKNVEYYDKIYDYLFQKIQNSKNDFDNKYKEQMDKFSKLVNGIVIPKKINDEDIYKPKEVYENDFDIHEEKNVILLRYFFELLIRVAFIKFSDDPNLTIGARAKMLFDILKSYFKSKKKSGVSNTLVMIASIDPRIHNPENSIESFISTHYISLEKIFSDLYSCSCNNENQYKRYDRTLTYRYFYENVILNSEEFSKVFEDKLTYIDIITLFHKQRKITSANIDTLEVTNDEIFEYIESALEYEMIFREFCELIYLVSRKYFLFYGITLEEDEIKGNMEKKKDEEVKRKKTKLKKKFKKEEKEDGEVTNEVEIHSQIDHNHKVEDFYMRIINEVEKITNILLQKSKYEGINKYEFPILKNHKVIERLKEEERLRKLEEERKERDRQRYNKERMLLKEEDVNMYKEEEEEGTGSDEESEY